MQHLTPFMTPFTTFAKSHATVAATANESSQTKMPLAPWSG